MRLSSVKSLQRRGAGAVALVLVSCSSAIAQLSSQLEPLLSGHRGEVAVSIKNLETGESFEHNAQVVMPTASLIKFPVMVEAYRQVEAGSVRLDTVIPLRAEDKVPGSGILTDHFQLGTQIPLETAIRLMIRYSDNTATNLVVDQIGLASTANTMKQMGMPETQLHSKVYRRDTSIALERSEKYGLGSTTASDMLRLLEQLQQKKLVSEKAAEAMLAHMASCTDGSQLLRELPKSVKAYHKTGAVSDIRTDAGLFQTPKGMIAMVVLTAKNKDTRWTEENEAEVLSGKIGLAAYQWFNPPGSESKSESKSLELGSSGDAVKAVQRFLNETLKPSPELSVDGDFGSMTETAVKRFQSEQKVAPTGKVDDSTWEKIGPLKIGATEDSDLRPLPPKSPADSLEGQPFVSCKGWVIYDPSNGKVVAGSNHTQRLDFASTTKMMTAWLVAKTAEKNPSALQETITYSKRADETVGSTSDVKAGESLTVGEALYGLMLPSGNDASVALGEHFGERLKPSGWDRSRDPLDMFIAAMNEEAKALGMGKTTFRNTHGLTHPDHKSTCLELAMLGQKLVESPLLREVIATREYKCKVKGSGGYQRELVWRNTNNLLGIEGYLGIKTGTTDAAGACLVSCGEREGQRLIVVVLGAAGSASRYSDTRNLYRYGWNQLR